MAKIEKNADNKNITDKNLAFAREYFIDRNGVQAAIRAGYSEKTAKKKAHLFLKIPEVKAEIDRLEAEAAKRSDVSVDYILKNLKEIIDRCMAVEPMKDPLTEELITVENEQGRVNAIGKFNPQPAIAAAKLLGDYLRMWDGDEKDSSVHIHVNE